MNPFILGLAVVVTFWLMPLRAAAGAMALPELPQPATSFGAVLADGWLYVYGGNRGKAHEFHRESVRGEFFRLKVPGGEAWEKLPGGTGLLGASLVEYEGKIVRIGGLKAHNGKGEKNALESVDEVMRFDPESGGWEKLPSLPKGRSSHDAVVVGDRVYVGGGWRLAGGEDAEWDRELYWLDLGSPEKGWNSEPQPFARRALAVVARAGRIWFLGGMDSDDKPSRAVDWFEPASGRWGTGPALPEGPVAGFGMAACRLGDRVIISPLSGKLSALSTDERSWEEVGELTPARFFHRLLALDGERLIAVGGSNRQRQIPAVELIEVGAGAGLKTVRTGVETGTKPSREGETSAGVAEGRGSWAQWRGPNRDGISPEKGWRKGWEKGGPPELWRAQVGVGMGSCVISEGRLITQGNDGAGTDGVFAFDAVSGAPLWKHTFACATAPHEMPIVPAGPGSTPTVVGGLVYALSREGDLFCLEAATGEVVWRKHLVVDLGGKRPVYGYTQSPLVAGGKLFLDVGAAAGVTGSTVALDAVSGELGWRAGTGEAGYSSARMLERDGRSFVAMFKGEALDLFDPADGRVFWSHRTTVRDFCNAMTPLFVAHRILISNTGTDPARLLDWDLGEAPNPREVWAHKQFALLFNQPILHQGALFAFNEKRRGQVEFTCVEAASGLSRWVSAAVPTGTFILSDDHWIFLTREGEVVFAPAASGELRAGARFQAVPGKCYATPALAGGVLYVRNNAGEIAAFDLRANPPR